MRTIQTELTKHRNFVSTMRHLQPELNKGAVMQTENGNVSPQVVSRVTAKGSNTRYKRTSEELEQDIAAVDQLVASGKFNQIEALNEIGLQSSVYHYKKRQQRLEPAKSDKPRKFAPRPTRRAETIQAVAPSFQRRKEDALKELRQERRAADRRENGDNELKRIKQEYEQLQVKYHSLLEKVVEKQLS